MQRAFVLALLLSLTLGLTLGLGACGDKGGGGTKGGTNGVTDGGTDSGTDSGNGPATTAGTKGASGAKTPEALLDKMEAMAKTEEFSLPDMVMLIHPDEQPAMAFMMSVLPLA